MWMLQERVGPHNMEESCHRLRQAPGELRWCCKHESCCSGVRTEGCGVPGCALPAPWSPGTVNGTRARSVNSTYTCLIAWLRFARDPRPIPVATSAPRSLLLAPLLHNTLVRHMLHTAAMNSLAFLRCKPYMHDLACRPTCSAYRDGTVGRAVPMHKAPRVHSNCRAHSCLEADK